MLRYYFADVSENVYARFFLNTVAGLTFFIFCYSIVVTKGRTINIFFLLPAAYILLTTKKKIREGFLKSIALNKIIALEIIIFSLFSFCWYRWLNTNNFSVVTIPHGDYIFYSSVTEYLNLFGRENIYLDYVYAAQTNVSPYHYYELWIGS